MVELLRRLALAESPSSVPAAQGPVFDLIEEALAPAASGASGASEGYRCRRLPGQASGGMFLAVPRRRARGGGAQLLLGHADTVWPLDTLERMPVRLEGGRLSGPGVYDMKAGLAQGIFALRALAELGLEPPAAPVLFVNSDEEIYSVDSLPMLRRLARRMRRVFVLEPSLGPEGRLKTRRKGVGRFSIEVHGRAAHAGLEPEKGASAVLELAHVIQRLHALNDPGRGISVNVGLVRGGQRINVVPPTAEAEVDVRIWSSEAAAEVERAVRALAPEVPGTTIEVQGGIERPALEPTPGNRALWEAARSCAARLGLPLAEGAAGGASDGNLTSPHAPTLDGLGAVGDGAHALHEHVLVDRMPERAALLALLLLAPLAAE